MKVVLFAVVASLCLWVEVAGFDKHFEADPVNINIPEIDPLSGRMLPPSVTYECVYKSEGGKLKVALGKKPKRQIIKGRCVQCFKCTRSGMDCSIGEKTSGNDG
ncbi:hypothetical protein LSAT2_005994 [Lamellibrachia satsuma]|nr:hypothetical protein LSAT2_005994 [Lamellibrachia satsuma]